MPLSLSRRRTLLTSCLPSANMTNAHEFIQRPKQEQRRYQHTAKSIDTNILFGGRAHRVPPQMPRQFTVSYFWIMMIAFTSFIFTFNSICWASKSVWSRLDVLEAVWRRENEKRKTNCHFSFSFEFRPIRLIKPHVRVHGTQLQRTKKKNPDSSVIGALINEWLAWNRRNTYIIANTPASAAGE